MAEDVDAAAGAPVDEERFRTASGECVVAGGEVRIQSSPASRARRYLEGGVGPLAVLGAILALCAVLLLSGDLSSQAIAVAILGLGALRIVREGLVTEGATTIAMGTIEHVEADPGGWGRPATLAINYRKDGDTTVRTVTLPPGWYSYADEAYDAGIAAFRERGVPVQEGGNGGDRAGMGVRS